MTAALPSVPEPIVATNSEGDGVQLRFVWHHDRFAHVIERIEQGHVKQVVWESIESASEQRWPASPPIQQLATHQVEMDRIVLGVGSAGVGHWSISCRAIADAERTGIEFDVALRCASEQPDAGSSYRIAAEDRRIGLNPLSAIAPTRLQTHEPSDDSDGSQTGWLRVCPEESGDGASRPTTVRWAYWISLTTAAK
jgi:hypothetical protein